MACISTIDNAGAGFCAKGVANILEAFGYPVTRTQGAYSWQTTLPNNGWQKVSGATATTCPVGGVLVFDRNNPPGPRPGGDTWGHVEIVVDLPSGRRYVSDAVRTNWGGTVPGNFVGCYTYPGSTTKKPDVYKQCMDGVN
jgi:hypothetical protein